MTTKPWYLYIAQSLSGKYYVGISTDVSQRIKTHNQGQGAQLAKFDGPFTLLYTSPPLLNQSTARSLEITIKKWPRDKKEKLVTNQLDLPL